MKTSRGSGSMKATSVAARAKKIPGQYTTVHQIHTTHSDATPSWSHAGCAVDAKRRGEMREFGRQCAQTGWWRRGPSSSAGRWWPARCYYRREISVGSYYDQSHYLHPHPYCRSAYRYTRQRESTESIHPGSAALGGDRPRTPRGMGTCSTVRVRVEIMGSSQKCRIIGKSQSVLN
jgi:hypothetical protein